MLRKLILLLVSILLLAACADLTTGEPTLVGAPEPAAPTASPPRSPVFYEIFVRSFYDSDGDGIGDFNGITQKLDYVQALGVNGIWLMPIFPSPTYHGYDTTDFYSVNPQYGSMEDFKNFLNEAHKRGLRVIIDLPLNHTSDQHPWFKEAKKPDSPYRNWYIWKEEKPNYKGPWGQDVWRPSTSGYYYAVFTAQMPDLNYRNPEVTQEALKITRYWLQEIGVDGYRLDAVKHLIEQGAAQENTVETHFWLKKEFYPTVKAANPQAFTIGELFGDDLETILAYTKGKQFDAAFHFQLAEAILKSVNLQDAACVSAMLQVAAQKLPPDSYAPFLTNHDQERAMNQLYNKTERAKLAAFLLLTSPGVPFIYYGEEIGMSGKKPDEDIRRPMQWSAEKNAGFSAGRPWRAPAKDYEFINVAFQEQNSDSLLNHYRALLRLRGEHPALFSGTLTILPTGNRSVFAALRADENETLLILVNLKDESVSNYQLQWESPLPGSAQTLFGGGEATPPQGAAYKPFDSLAPNAMFLIQFK